MIFADGFEHVGEFTNVWNIFLAVKVGWCAHAEWDISSLLTSEQGVWSPLLRWDRQVISDNGQASFKLCRRQTYYFAFHDSTTKWGIGDNGDSQLTARFQQPNFIIFNVKHKRRIFGLECSDGMDGVRTAKSVGGNFAQTEIFYFSISRIALD